MSKKRKPIVDESMRSLITTITGFQTADENFDVCVNFAKSNFKYHRFLSPDSHKLDRDVKGLCEKFEVHSQPKKAGALRDLVDSFLEQTGLDGKDVGKTDIHYAMLSLLLELAESPTNTSFQRQVKDIVEEEVDSFDWTGHLLDKEDLIMMSYTSSDSEEEDDIETSCEENDDPRDGAYHCHDDETSDELNKTSNYSGDKKTLISKSQMSHDLSIGVKEDEYVQLEKILMVPYWEGRSKEEMCSGDHLNSNLIRDWNCYKKKINQFDQPTGSVVVTEYQVIRETLWMLSGITDLFIFNHSGKEFCFNHDVYLMHMTPESLECSLQPLMRKANQVQTLVTFVSGIVGQNNPGLFPQDGDGASLTNPQTYQAFACSVHKFLSSLRHFLVEVERGAMKQEKILTIDSLASDLKPWLNKVEVVYGVFITGVAQASHHYDTASNCVKTTALLDTLYDAVFEADLLSGKDEEGKGELLFQMLIDSLEPLLRIASDWVNYGQLIDPGREFVIHRNKDIKSLDETFWEKAFVSNLHQNDVFNTTVSADNQSAPYRSTSTTKSSVSSQTSTSTLKPSEISSLSSALNQTICADPVMYPKFLRSILGQVILTGKSMEMLENLGRMGEALEMGASLFDRPQSLYEHLVHNLKPKMTGENLAVSTTTGECIDGLQTGKQQSNLVDKQLLHKGDKDTFLHINMAALFPTKVKGQQKHGQHNESHKVKHHGPPLSQVLRMCENILCPYVDSRYNRVCSSLLHILKSEYHLVQCIHAMQRYFLMSSGEVMYDFYTAIFQKIAAREPWKEPELLEMFLQEAVENLYPEDAVRLSVSVVPLSREQTEHSINATDCIQIRYQVPWPVDVVVSSSCQAQYNDIFNFLLQIKRSKFTLEQLRFEELSKAEPDTNNSFLTRLGVPEEVEEMSNGKRLHRFQLLRFRLLYFVNSLHNYMMTRILHSSGLEFSQELAEAADLDQVIQIHHNYVRLIHDRCLLVPKLAFLKKSICLVLNLSLTFSAQWRRGITNISGEAVVKLEQELARCIHFLASFLNNVIKRGSFPHLESLAFALVTSLQNIQEL